MDVVVSRQQMTKGSVSKLLTLTFHFALLASLFGATARAERSAHVIEAHVERPGGARSHKCEVLFQPLEPIQIVETIHRLNESGERDVTQLRYASEERSKAISRIVIRVLSHWIDTRDYTADQARILWGRDRKLDPRRTIYIHNDVDGAEAMLRIFDGSTRVMRGALEWKDASLTSSKMPMEDGTPGFIVPEHRWAQENVDRPAYVWEISLLDVDRKLSSGVESLLSHVASRLDTFYNDHEYRTLGRSRVLESRNMMIYAQTRANRVALFRKYGFEPVMMTNSRGETFPYEVSNNLILVAMKAEEFLKRHGENPQFASRKGKPKAEPYNDDGSREKTHKHIEDIERRRVMIRDQHDLIREFQRVFSLYVAARQMTKKTAERRDVIIEFMEAYHTLLVSIPEPLRDPNWIQMRNTMREFISQPTPYEGFYYFTTMIDRQNDRSIEIGTQFMNAFYEDAPTRPIILSIPSKPVFNLRLGPR